MKKSILRILSFSLLIIMVASMLPIGQVLAAGYNPATDTPVLEEVDFYKYDMDMDEIISTFYRQHTFAVETGKINYAFADGYDYKSGTGTGAASYTRRINTDNYAPNVRIKYSATQKKFTMFEYGYTLKDGEIAAGWQEIANISAKDSYTFDTHCMHFYVYVPTAAVNADLSYYVTNAKYTQGSNTYDMTFADSNQISYHETAKAANAIKYYDGGKTLSYENYAATGNNTVNFAYSAPASLNINSDYTLEFYLQCAGRIGVGFGRIGTDTYAHGFGFGPAYARRDIISADGLSLVISGTEQGYTKGMYTTKLSNYNIDNNTYTLSFSLESTDLLNDRVGVVLASGAALDFYSGDLGSRSTNDNLFFGFSTVTDNTYNTSKESYDSLAATRHLEWMSAWSAVGGNTESSTYLTDAVRNSPTRMVDADNHHSQQFKVVINGGTANDNKATVSIYALCAETESYLLYGSKDINIWNDSLTLGLYSPDTLTEGEHVALRDVKIYSGDIASDTKTSSYSNAVNAQLLYTVDFTGADGEFSQLTNRFDVWNADASLTSQVSAAHYVYNPYTGESDSTLLINKANSCKQSTSVASSLNYHVGNLTKFPILNNKYTISYWAEKESDYDYVNDDGEAYDAFDMGMYFVDDGVYHGFQDINGESNRSALIWKYNDGVENFYVPTTTVTVTNTSTGAVVGTPTTTTGSVIYGRGTKKSTTTSTNNTTTGQTTTTVVSYPSGDSYLTSAVNRAVDKNNGNRQYYKVVLDGVSTPPTLNVYALSVKGYYELCGTKELDSAGLADATIKLGIYSYEKMQESDYFAMGGVKIYKGDVTSVPLTVEEQNFLEAATAKETFDNGETRSYGNLLYNVDFRQSWIYAYGVQSHPTYTANKYNTYSNSAGYTWGIANVNDSYNDGTMADTYGYPLRYSYDFSNGYGLTLSNGYTDEETGLFTATHMNDSLSAASYMPYKNNWQFGNYTIDFNYTGNSMFAIAVLEVNGMPLGFRCGLPDWTNNAMVDRDTYKVSTFANSGGIVTETINAVEITEHKDYLNSSTLGQLAKYYDYYTGMPQIIKDKTGLDNYVKPAHYNIYMPEDGSANVKIEFDNDNNFITYYYLVNSSTDANVTTLEWIPYGSIEYYDNQTYYAIFGASGYEYDYNDDNVADTGENVDVVNISNVNVWGDSFYSMYNEKDDGEAFLTVDFEGANHAGYDSVNKVYIPSDGNSSGYHWNTTADFYAASVAGVYPLDTDGDGFFETLYLNHTKQQYIDAGYIASDSTANGYAIRAAADTTIKNNWKYGSFTLELAVNAEQSVNIGLLRASNDTVWANPYGFTVSGNRIELYDRIETAGGEKVAGTDPMLCFHNARFANGGMFLYEDGFSSQGVDNRATMETAGISFDSYYSNVTYYDNYVGGDKTDSRNDINEVEVNKNSADYYNHYPVRVDTSETGEKNVKIEFNNTLKQMTLYELCYNDDNLSDNVVDMTNGYSWKKIGMVDFSKAFDNHLKYLEPSLYFYTWEWGAEAYFTNIQVVRGLTANYNAIGNFDDLAFEEEFISAGTLGTEFVKADSHNGYGINMPFDLASSSSYTVSMLVNTDSMQTLSLLKTNGSNYAYSTVGFTFDANNAASLSPSFVVDDQPMSASNPFISNEIGVQFNIYDATAPRHYEEGVTTENVKIEFNSVDRKITLYELTNVAEAGAAQDLRYVKVADMIYSDFSDYMAIFEGTMAYENVSFTKGLSALNIGLRAKQISSPYALDGVYEEKVDVRYVATLENENYYYAGATAYLVEKGDSGVKTSNTITRTVDSAGLSTTGSDLFNTVTANELGASLLYSVTIKGIPVSKLDWIEIHVTPFTINQKFKDNGDFAYNDATNVNDILADWDFGNGDTSLGMLGAETVTIIGNGGKEIESRPEENYDMIERSVSFDGTKQTDLRVMASNVYGHTAYKNEYRADMLAKTIKSYSPDIVGFNEVWSWEFEKSGTLDAGNTLIMYNTLTSELSDRYTFVNFTANDYYYGSNASAVVSKWGATLETGLAGTVNDTNCQASCPCNDGANKCNPPVQIALRKSAGMTVVAQGWRYQMQIESSTGTTSSSTHWDPYEHLHGMGWVALTLNGGDKVLYVDGHLATPKNDGGTYTTFRMEDIESLINDALAKVGWTANDTAVIVSGDYYMDVTKSQKTSYDYLINNMGLSNAQLDAEQKWTPNQGTSHVSGASYNAEHATWGGMAEAATGRSYFTHSKLDLIMYRAAQGDSVNKMTCLGHTCISRLQSLEISDHIPVISDFSFD